MEKVRLLPFERAAGPHNMAADEVLLHSAAAGTASLRFYAWNEATLSLGYFQPSASRLNDPRLASLPYVRRPTGGATLVHHHELTYALALPAACDWQRGEPWLVRMHEIIAAALTAMGVPCRLVSDKEGPGHAESALCFQQFTPGDLLCAGAKVAGSAQRKQRDCLLQHGAILLDTSPHAPQIQGIQELCGRRLSDADINSEVIRQFEIRTGWQLSGGNWTDSEWERIAQTVRERYSTAGWNDKR